MDNCAGVALSLSNFQCFEFLNFNTTFTMHNALAVLASIFFFTSSTCAFHLPQLPFFATPKPPHHDLSNKCTFTLWQKQMCSASKKTNYIQVFEIQDHANDLTIDIASLRPAASHNSYIKISPTNVFAIKGLLDDKSLVISGWVNDNDKISFDNNGLHFTSDTIDAEDAWCLTGEWDTERWECGQGSRVSWVSEAVKREEC